MDRPSGKEQKSQGLSHTYVENWFISEAALQISGKWMSARWIISYFIHLSTHSLFIYSIPYLLIAYFEPGTVLVFGYTKLNQGSTDLPALKDLIDKNQQAT